MTKRWQPGDRMECDFSFVADRADIVEEGYIAGIASTPSFDLYGHKVMARAFDESIRKRGLSGPRGVKLLAQHDKDKPAGVIRRLETVGDDLRIEAQLATNVSYVRDLYEVTKLNGGLSFSVGFLEDFDWLENDATGAENLIIKKGDLIEVSVVTFPALPEASMDFVKQREQHETMAELEKALVAKEYCRSRNEAHRLATYLKSNEHLFLGKSPPSAGPATPSAHPTHPLLDVVHQLRAATDLAVKAKAVLGSR